MKISSLMILVNIAFIAIISLLSGLAVFQIYSLDHIYNQSKNVAVALKNQVERDMMHDGLRADVLFAVKLAREGNMEGRPVASSHPTKAVKVNSSSRTKQENQRG